MHERDILLAALDLTQPLEREAYLAQACGTDPELRSRVDALVRASVVEDSFLERPAFETELLNPETDALGQKCMQHDELSLDFLHPTDDPQTLGRLGYYDVLEVLGHGGFGVVLKARDTKLDRIVAVKTLALSLASSATARKRFVREAKAAAAVKHENVVGIYHVADDGPVPYLVMECVSGLSLEAKLQQVGTLDLPAILRIGMQVASGLAAAHKQGLVHRDVKPGNILLENGVERVKITDFGLARAADDAAITKTGEVAGTPQYMSPEQAQGLPLDARSDLFSLGSVLYAMATGRSPFRAESTVAALRRVCDDTPRPVREINSDIPDWLEEIISRLLAKQPSERFQTASEVAELLGRYLAHVQQPAIDPSPKPRIASPRDPSAIRARQWSVALIALVAIACIMGPTEASGVTKVVPTVIRIVRGEGTLVIEVDDPTVQVSLDGEALSIHGAGLQELRLLPGEYRLHATKDGRPVKDEVVTISRDGRKVVTVTREGPGGSGSPGVAPAVERTVGELKLLAKLDGHTDVVRAVAFLPDGRRMVSVGRDKMVRIWDVETRSTLSTLPVEGYLKDADVSADGRFIAMAFTSSGKAGVIHVWDLEKRERILELVQDGIIYINSIRFSPDGMHVVTCGNPSDGVLWDLSTGSELRRFDVDDKGNTAAVEFSPDGRLLAIGAVGRVRLFDVESGDVLGDIRLPTNRGVNDLVFTATGKTLACGRLSGNVSLIDVDSRQVMKSLQASDSPVVRVRLFDNDQFLLATCFDATLRILDIERGKVVAIAATEKGTNERVAISPDGRYAVTASGEDWEQSRGHKPNGDYALRLWQLPKSIWPAASRPTSLPADTTNQTPKAEAGAFVVLGGNGVAERRFDTLAEAAQAASDGDTIEIRGNGPFSTPPIKITNAVAIRAGAGFRPVIEGAATEPADSLMEAAAPLVLEGLELRWRYEAEHRAGWTKILTAWKALHVANCKFATRCVQVQVVAQDGPYPLELRNCEFLAPANFEANVGIQTTFAVYPHVQRKTSLDNCLSTCGLFLMRRWGFPHGAELRLTHNTLRTQFEALQFNVAPGLGGEEDFAAEDWTKKSYEVSASGNVMAGDGILMFAQQALKAPLPPGEAENLLARMVGWRGERNAYLGASALLRLKRASPGARLPPPLIQSGLAGWKQLWGTAEEGSIEGSARFMVGDLLTKANSAPEELTPYDFRLRPDSPGYRAGPDGKDLGADIDLVGPGAAYERWKKTPEYQEWVNETKQSMVSGP
jgi:serine/threonine protein kinase/WD40 repeat protein